MRNRGIAAPRAAVQGARQVRGAIVASTLTTVCVFLPMVFTTGTVREMLLPLALSVSYCLMASLIVALTVIPASASTILRRVEPRPNAVMERIQKRYGDSLRWCLAHRAIPLALSVGLLALSVMEVLRIGVVVLPEMTSDESLEVTQIHSILGLVDPDNPLVTTRPFRSPHHTVTAVGLAGGGSVPKPGEISLAHRGVLFLDELPEFRKETMEVLRQPLEDGKVTITRATGSETYPCEFMLVCAMNPCRCGWYGDPSGRCTCSEQSVRG
jgi:hypothetical protein